MRTWSIEWNNKIGGKICHDDKNCLEYIGLLFLLIICYNGWKILIWRHRINTRKTTFVCLSMRIYFLMFLLLVNNLAQLLCNMSETINCV